MFVVLQFFVKGKAIYEMENHERNFETQSLNNTFSCSNWYPPFNVDENVHLESTEHSIDLQSGTSEISPNINISKRKALTSLKNNFVDPKRMKGVAHIIYNTDKQ